MSTTAETVAALLTEAFSADKERVRVAGVPLSTYSYLALFEVAARGESLTTAEARMEDLVIDDLTDLRDGHTPGDVLARISQFVGPVDESRRNAWREYVAALCAHVESKP